DLITGIIKPTSGNIIINGIKSKDINYPLFRKRIGYVTQDCVVFDDTIANNICLWSEDFSKEKCEEKIKLTAESANCTEFINQKLDSYNTIIGERGVNLSGGQKQRLVIARELFKEPKILILDEATSSLDSSSEKFIKESINSLKGKMTIIIIAHRLSTVRSSDVIYVLNDSKILESGSFDELIMRDSKFKEMCELQKI
ncbi:MAG: ATP-binding cassette domain-containing protein, partial [Proteobacteria bacterium]|nr:ATP-binding cassette domain-containing protein [Pseudomonadota bacterium]